MKIRELFVAALGLFCNVLALVCVALALERAVTDQFLSGGLVRAIVWAEIDVVAAATISNAAACVPIVATFRRPTVVNFRVFPFGRCRDRSCQPRPLRRSTPRLTPVTRS